MDLINVSRRIMVDIEKLDDIVDSYFEPIKDLTDTASDIFTPIKAIHSLYTFNKKIKFKKFLKAYAKSLNENGFSNFDDTEKLKRYLKDEKNFNFLSDTIENAINSKSMFGSVLLGYYAGQILSQCERINYKDLIIIEGLKELNDIELSCFARIYNRADLSKMVIFHELNLRGFEFFSKLTIDKLIQLRFITKDHTVYHGSNGSYNFISTNVAEELFFLIKVVGLNDELLNFHY
ncbi:hypothetical protein CLU81_4958 [Flavobacterium sp. 9]|uniref:hypothetical protein n=1 Tax=Flavobacterium sp. 9 TaxID=2035198 RepID=UPI000C3EC3B5|nr:hypothetical protein [Flavobacterium sp. 9]PIF34319.1 hypothetical protein CLU81_4958 [Flavobacterium sp. 9]